MSVLTLRQARKIAREHLRHATFRRCDYTDTWCIMFPRWKIAYIPIPKAANSSIRAELLRLIDVSPADVAQIEEFNGFDIRRFSECVSSIDASWLLFTVVREPFSRIASAYLDKLVERQTPFPALRRMGLLKGHTFEQFLRVISLWPKNALNDHFMPQSLLLGRAMTVPKLRIFKMEDLPDVWPDICQEIEQRSGIVLQPLERRNRSNPGGSWRDLYNERSISLVRKVYSQDFSFLNYKNDFF